jgi:hypothetical protein
MTNKIFKISIVLILIGIVFTTIGLIAAKGDVQGVVFRYNIDEEYTFVEEEVTEVLTTLDFNSVNRKLSFKVSDDDTFYVDYYTSEKDRIDFSIEDSTMVFKNIVARQTFRLFQWTSPHIANVNIYVPSSFDGELVIKNTNGKIEIVGLDQLLKISISVTNGAIDIQDVTSRENIVVSTTNGGVYLKNVQTPADVRLSTTNGNLDVENSVIDGQLRMRSSNGKIAIKNITSDHIDMQTTNGTIVVTMVGNPQDYLIDVQATNGKIKINDITYGNQVLYPLNTKEIRAQTTNGNITMNFTGA